MGFLEKIFGSGGQVPRVEGARAHELVKGGASIVDVRSPGEFEGGHVPGAINIPVDQVPARADELDREQPVIVYCRTGARSDKAGRALQERGFEVYNLVSPDRW